MAVARAIATTAAVPVLSSLALEGATPALPWPSFNVVNGGAHAQNRLNFREFMITPVGAPSMAEAVRAGAQVYAALRRRLTDRGLSTGLGDEGGFAPEIDSPEDVLAALVDAIGDAGYTAGKRGVAIALDAPASEFFRDGAYEVNGTRLSSDDMISRHVEIVDRFPVWSLEDGLAEGDWDHDLANDRASDLLSQVRGHVERWRWRESNPP